MGLQGREQLGGRRDDRGSLVLFGLYANADTSWVPAVRAKGGAGVFRVAEPGKPAEERRETEAQR